MAKAKAAAIASLGPSPQAPQSAQDAERLTVTIATALAKQNFLQPISTKDWPATLGIAFQEHNLTPDQLQSLLSYAGNKARAPYINKTAPIYFVDCDMGALLIMSVAARYGWDVRLVEVPKHNFVRWHLPNGDRFNWDWTAWASLHDDDYMGHGVADEALRKRGVFLRSFDQAEARGYYLSLIGANASTPEKGTPLLEQAVSDGAKDPTSYNNLAWNYVTQQALAKPKSPAAMQYAMAAWSTKPEDGNVIDTAACAFAAAGHRALALAMEDFAIEHASSTEQKQGYIANRKRMEEGAICS